MDSFVTDQAALILEGGGMRGVYTAGVLDCFHDHGLYFKDVYAVSAGSCHACSYLSRQRGRAVKTVIDYAGNWRYASFRSLLLTGDFFGVKMAYDDVPNRYLPFDYDAYMQFPSTLWAVVTNCETGEAEYLPVHDLRTGIIAVRASSSMPYLSRIVKIDGKKYLDGGVADSIPIQYAKKQGYQKNIVVLTRHRGYRKEGGGLSLLYGKYPNLVRKMKERPARYNETLELIEREEAAGGALVIRPGKPVAIRRLERDTEKLKALYEEGFRDAEVSMESIISFIKVGS